MKMMNPAALLVMPNQIMAKGIQARGGMGRSSSTMGSMTLSATLNQPMIIPAGRASIRPAPSPMAKCRELTGRSSRMMEDQFSKKARTTSIKLGRVSGSSTKKAASCHIARNPKMEMAEMP